MQNVFLNFLLSRHSVSFHSQNNLKEVCLQIGTELVKTRELVNGSTIVPAHCKMTGSQ